MKILYNFIMLYLEEGVSFMDKQYKLYIVDSDGANETLQKLGKQFRDKIYIMSTNKIAIEYDYGINSYKNMLENVDNLRVSQSIITSNKFYSLLKKCIKDSIIIYSIKLADIFQEDNERISSYINKINKNVKDKAEYINALLSELKWYNYNQGIDIKSMEFIIRDKNKPINIRFGLYDNGVLLIDDEEIEEKVFKIIETIM